MGSRAEVEGYALSPAIRIAWAPDGDHDLKPRKASGHSFAENLAAAADRGCRDQSDGPRPCGSRRLSPPLASGMCRAD